MRQISHIFPAATSDDWHVGGGCLQGLIYLREKRWNGAELADPVFLELNPRFIPPTLQLVSVDAAEHLRHLMVRGCLRKVTDNPENVDGC